MRKSFIGLTLLMAAGILTSCGGNADNGGGSTNKWAKMNWSDYDSLYITDEKPEDYVGPSVCPARTATPDTYVPYEGDFYDLWEIKPVKYQFVMDPSGQFNHGFTAYFPSLFNFYEDGSIKGWQSTFFIPSMFDSFVPYKYEGESEELYQAAVEFYDSRKTLEVFYGYWEENDDGTLDVHLQNSFDWSCDGKDIVYSNYTCPAGFDESGKKSFYINLTEKGQAIYSLITCNNNYEGTIQYDWYYCYGYSAAVRWPNATKSA